jgi:hypothetical protein
MFNAFLKVNMTNPMPFVAVAAVVCEFHWFIYIYICTQLLLESLDKKALHCLFIGRVCWMYLLSKWMCSKCAPRVS